MLLAIDVGNSETVVGAFPGPDNPAEGLLDHWRVSTVAERTGDELALLVDQLLGLRDLSLLDDVTGVVVSSVVPRVTGALRDMAGRFTGHPALVLEPGVKSGLPILYDNPKEVGADRIANAVAAFDVYGGPTIVVDFSPTATVFDAISAKGEYLGGAITPGVEVSLDGLFDRAAGLRRVELVPPRNVIGRSIVESIQSGVVHGLVALVDGIIGRFEEVLGPSTLVVTGGHAGLVARLSSRHLHEDPWLTLHGLRLVWLRNQ